MDELKLACIIADEIADWFANVEDITMSVGGPETVEEAQRELTERILALIDMDA
jgi:hypothetical protein